MFDPVPPVITEDRGLGEWITQVSIILNRILVRSFVPEPKRVAAHHTVLKSETYIGVTSTAAARTITIPEHMTDGHIIVVKDESGAAGTNNITIARTGTDTIDGATSLVISSNYGVARLICNGAGAWFTI